MVVALARIMVCKIVNPHAFNGAGVRNRRMYHTGYSVRDTCMVNERTVVNMGLSGWLLDLSTAGININPTLHFP